MSKKQQKEMKNTKKPEEDEINLVDSDWDSDFDTLPSERKDESDRDDDENDPRDWKEKQKEKADKRWNEVMFGASSKAKEKTNKTATTNGEVVKANTYIEQAKKTSPTKEQQKTSGSHIKGQHKIVENMNKTQAQDTGSDIWIDSDSSDDVESFQVIEANNKTEVEKASNEGDGSVRNRRKVKTKKGKKQKRESAKPSKPTDVNNKPFIPSKDGKLELLLVLFLV